MKLLELVLSKKKTIWLVLLVLSCVFIFQMTLIGRASRIRQFELNVFWAFRELISHQPDAYEDIGLYFKNILLFIPFVFDLAGCTDGKWKLVFIAGICVSVAVETTQYLLTIGLAEIDDLTSNTLGAIIGCFLFKLFKTRKKK